VVLKTKLEKTKNQEDKFKKNSILLDEMVANQKAPKDKEGLGFEKGKSSKTNQTSNNAKKKNNYQKKVAVKKGNNRLIRNQKKNFKRPPIRQPTVQRYSGYCYSYNKFGHKAMECRSRMNQNTQSFFGQCFSCQRIGHKVCKCRNQMMNDYNKGMMVSSFNGYCYTCSRFGHKTN